MAHKFIIQQQHMKQIEMYIKGQTKTEIQKELKVHPTTVFGWFKHDVFLQEYENQIKEIRKKTTNKIITMVDDIITKQQKDLFNDDLNGKWLLLYRDLVNNVILNTYNEKTESNDMTVKIIKDE